MDSTPFNLNLQRKFVLCFFQCPKFQPKVYPTLFDPKANLTVQQQIKIWICQIFYFFSSYVYVHSKKWNVDFKQKNRISNATEIPL